MGVSPVQLVRFYNPYWPATVDNWSRGNNSTVLTNFPAGITLPGVPHPLNNLQNEQILRIDGNQAHDITLAAASDGGGVNYAKPDSTHQWSMRESQIIEFLSTDNLPSSQAFLFGSSRSAAPLTWGLWLNTNGTLTLKTYDNSSVEVDFTSTATVSFDDVWRQYEVWAVLCSDSGANLTQAYWVVRVVENITTTRDTTLWLAGFATDLPSRSFTMGMLVGEVTARGAGFAWDMCNSFGAIEDAKQPWGIIRGDMMYPNGDGHRREFQGNHGTATGSTATTMTDSGAAWVVNAYTGFTVTMGGSTAVVTSNTATALTFAAWSPLGPATGAYVISDGPNSIDFNTVNEMGDPVLANRVPSDAGGNLFDFTVFWGGSAQVNTYLVTNPGYVTGSDSVAGVAIMGRTNTSVVPKGASADFELICSDGTNDRNVDSIAQGTSWNSTVNNSARTGDGASGWTKTALDNLEVGVSIDNATGATPTLRVTTLEAVAAWQAAGETTPALNVPMVETLMPAVMPVPDKTRVVGY